MSIPPEHERGLSALLREDWIAHQRDWTRPGFRALAIYRFGCWRYSQPAGVRHFLGFVHRVLFRFARNVYGIELPASARIGRRVVFEHQSGIVVHGNAIIGDDCVIRQNVTLGNRHRDRLFDAPELGCRVDVGAGAKVLGRVRVGDDARIGANAVVLEDVPAGATAVGVPARVQRPGANLTPGAGE